MKKLFYAAISAICSPVFVAVASLALGASLAAAGVYVLSGIGWALLTGSVPILLLSFVLIRGLTRGR